MGVIMKNKIQYTDGSGEKHDYSTDEQVVGTWIDEKPIYETTYIFSSPLTIETNLWTNTPVLTSDKETIIKVVGIHPLGTCWNYMSAAINNSQYVRLLNVRNEAITIDRLILQYTKTTN